MGDEEVRAERLARVEEQVKGLRDDFTDFRAEMRDMWSTMIENSVTHEELNSKLEVRDLRISKLEEQVKEIKKEKESSVSRKYVFWASIVAAIAGACVTGLVGLIATLLHK